MKNFNKYSKENIHFYDENLPNLLEEIIPNKEFNILDLGCGDGRIFYALHKKGLLKNANKIRGVDLSKERCKQAKKILPKIKTICSDACNVKELENNSFDIIISNQVIEHMPNDNLLLKEIRRLLKKDGKLYLSTVLKKWYGIYIYRNNGKFVLDPTHIREYKSPQEIEYLFKKNSLKILKLNIKQTYFPVLDLFIRILNKLNIVKDVRNVYLKNSFLNNIRDIFKIPIIGYKSIEVIGTK